MEHKAIHALMWHNSREPEADLVEALATTIVPELKKLIKATAKDVLKRYESDSPFAADLAQELLIKELVAFLALGEVEDCVTIKQMRPSYVRWWLQAPE